MQQDRMQRPDCAEGSSDGGYSCRMHVKSGTEQAFSGRLAKLSAGQRAFFLHLLSHEPLQLGQSPLCVPVALG